MKTKLKLACIVAVFVQEPALSGDVSMGNEPGSVVYSGRKYSNIIGEKDGAFRSLTEINGIPALFSGDRDTTFYSLSLYPSKKEIVIDCAYIETRNKYNGAGVYAGMCGLKNDLNSEYDSIVYKYSQFWMEKIYSFDTRKIYQGNKPASFLLGKIGGLSIYNTYPSRDAFENATPETYVKSNRGCYYTENIAFLIFTNNDPLNIKYIDILESSQPMVLRRLDGRKLKDISTEKCPAGL